MANPLLADWTDPYELPPFEAIQDDHFPEAMDAALSEARAAVDAIVAQEAPPTFENTIEALEMADATLSKVAGVFYNLVGADANEARQSLQRDLSPKMAAYSSDILMNEGLFARVEALWQERENLGLTEEQARVLMLTRRGFTRAGAELTGADRHRYREIMERLAILGTGFTQNLLADEREWFMELSESDLEGLPEFLIDSARSAGEEKGVGGPVITLSRSLITPFLAASPRRDLRKRAYEAYTARGANGGKTDNRAIAAEVLKLREERARLLGYDNFAAYKLETQMAGTADRVRELLNDVWRPARNAANNDAAILEQMLHADGVAGPLEPWDWHYYSEKRRQEEHDLDEARVKPFLQLDRMIEAAFATANRLFGLKFERLDTPGYHPDVRTYEVTRGGDHIAIFMGDYFARGSKRSGAWCSAMRSQKKLGGETRPIVVNVCNFARPEANNQTLLSFDDARTLFHEFGHALHQMLSDVTYESISGTSVARDFVELPSQLFEHWLEVPEVLAEYATHAETGEPMPRELLDRLLGAATYDMGFATVEYVASALVDLEFHSGPAPVDPMQKQAEVLEDLGMPHAIRMRHATPHFAHVFSGDGYSAGYYSYMWSEVMDADAFEAFLEAGSAFDKVTARAFEDNILSRGGSAEAQDLYLAFRGKMPEIDALLKGRGLVAAE
ncbi:M3 family metallopeptidase [Maritimibacter dapengensis]|uniref:M3 family metallopeptidase n=1 Tax=Maritimibacter dapengensis TaxID=2836868 RepID=A0ABS6T5Z1_9RHOB|nr:M3 family metallopeptidase [Maritimibacter dapengensis]MBV7380667.1 M3 family metallopeptidase [Maritimibacter dapengensis]